MVNDKMEIKKHILENAMDYLIKIHVNLFKGEYDLSSKIEDYGNYYSVSIICGSSIKFDYIYTKAGEMLFCVPSFDGVLQCFDQDNFMVISADSDNKMVGRHYRMVNDNDYKLVNSIRDINSTMSKELSTIGFGVQADSLLRYSNDRGSYTLYNYKKAKIMVRDYDSMYGEFLGNYDKFDLGNKSDLFRVVKNISFCGNSACLEFLVDEYGRIYTPFIYDFVRNYKYSLLDGERVSKDIDVVSLIDGVYQRCMDNLKLENEMLKNVRTLRNKKN